MYMSATYNTLYRLFCEACTIDDLFMMIWSEVEEMVERGPEIEDNEIFCCNGLTHFFSVYGQVQWLQHDNLDGGEVHRFMKFS